MSPDPSPANGKQVEYSATSACNKQNGISDFANDIDIKKIEEEYKKRGKEYFDFLSIYFRLNQFEVDGRRVVSVTKNIYGYDLGNDVCLTLSYALFHIWGNRSAFCDFSGCDKRTLHRQESFGVYIPLPNSIDIEVRQGDSRKGGIKE